MQPNLRKGAVEMSNLNFGRRPRAKLLTQCHIWTMQSSRLADMQEHSSHTPQIVWWVEFLLFYLDQLQYLACSSWPGELHADFPSAMLQASQTLSHYLKFSECHCAQLVSSISVAWVANLELAQAYGCHTKFGLSSTLWSIIILHIRAEPITCSLLGLSK